jgi:hypothetical protein
MAWYDFLIGTDPETYKDKYGGEPDTRGSYGATAFGQGQMYNAQGRPATQTGIIERANALDTTRESQTRGRQSSLADALESAAAGKGPSAAAMAAGQARTANLQQAAALQAGRRGAASLVGALGANNQVAMGNQAIAGQESVARAQEMAQARGELGSVLGNIRGQDIGVAGQNAQIGLANTQMYNQNQQFNANLTAEQRRQNDQYALAQQGLLQNQAQTELGARLGNLQPGTSGMLPGLISAGATLGAAALSDRNAKYGTRETRWSAIADAIAGAAGTVGGMYLAKKEKAKEDAEDKKRQDEKDAADNQKEIDQKLTTANNSSLAQAFPHAEEQNSTITNSPVTAPSRGSFVNSAVNRIITPTIQQIDPQTGLPIQQSYIQGSDENMKKGIKPVRDMIDALSAYEYSYRDDSGRNDHRKHVGIMAQDLEKTKLGKQFVEDDPKGTGYKAVDYGMMLPALAAGIADINERLSKVESKKKKVK